MKKLLYLITILAIAGSCNEDEIVKNQDSIAESFINSKAFLNLNVDLAELDMNRFEEKEIDANTKSILIPFKGELKYVISRVTILSENNFEFKDALTFEYLTHMNYEQLSKAIQNKTFKGEYKIESSKYDITMSADISKQAYVNSKSAKACRGTVGSDAWVQDVANCASDRIDQMNWLDYSLCILTIPECWATTVASCIIDGCDTNPS